MLMRKIVPVLLIALLFGLPLNTLAAGHDHQGHHGEAPSPHGVALSPALMVLLNQEMGLIQQGMMDLVPAIAAGQWHEAAVIGQKIKASFILKQKLTAEQKEELHRVLPEQFVEMDQDFHHAAGMLAHAAEMHNADVVNFYFYKMNDACVACHAKYAAERFPGLAKGGGEGGHHH